MRRVTMRAVGVQDSASSPILSDRRLAGEPGLLEEVRIHDPTIDELMHLPVARSAKLSRRKGERTIGARIVTAQTLRAALKTPGVIARTIASGISIRRDANRHIRPTRRHQLRICTRVVPALAVRIPSLT